MKFVIEFDSEKKSTKFFIDGEEVQWDNFSICYNTSDQCVVKGTVVKYDKNENKVEECHEITYSLDTGDVIHYEGKTASMLLTTQDLIDKQKESRVEKIFQPRKVKESNMNQLLPKPGNINDGPRDLSDYLPNFRPAS